MAKTNENYYIGFRAQHVGFRVRGGLRSRLIMGIMRVTIWLMGVSDLLTKSP